MANKFQKEGNTDLAFKHQVCLKILYDILRVATVALHDMDKRMKLGNVIELKGINIDMELIKSAPRKKKKVKKKKK